MSDMRDSLMASDAAGSGSRYAELSPEQTTTGLSWYNQRSTRIALCVALLLVVTAILIIPLVMSRGGEDIAKFSSGPAGGGGGVPVSSSSAASFDSSSSAADSSGGAAGYSSSSSMMPPPPVDWSSSSSTGGASPAPVYVANVTFAGMYGRQFGSDEAQHVVIAMPNVFGVGAALYNLSQTFAEHGYRVYAMDIFRGDPANSGNFNNSWWARHNYNDTVRDMVTVLDAIRTTAPPMASLQAVGYCYGGGVALGLTTIERPLRSVVSAHPTWENPRGQSELGELENRVSTDSQFFVVMPQDDPQFNDRSRLWINASVHRNIESLYKIYKNTRHGFAFDLGDPRYWNAHNWTQRASAARDTLYWLDTHRHIEAEAELSDEL